MRFVFFLLLPILIGQPAFAAPGDKFNAQSASSDKPATFRQSRSNEYPVAPEGFAVKKGLSNLGRIVSLAVAGNDVFVADANQNRVLRLKSRNADAEFETRAEFLIGFNGLNDLAFANGNLYMSDKVGVWRIEAGEMLVASQAPKLIYANREPITNKPISMSISPDKKTLILGVGDSIVGLNTETGEQKLIARGNWRVQNIAVSPTGSVWASVLEYGASTIMPIRPGTENSAKLTLPDNVHIKDIGFWNQDSFPDTWPAEWKSDLLISITGARPMLARAHFHFGDIENQYTAFIDGFSAPSRFVGRRDYWGQPTAFEILTNGQLIFAEAEQGTIWVLEQNMISKDIPEMVNTLPAIREAKPNLDKKPVFPELIFGSSIKSASGLETDELLKAPQQDNDEKNLEDNE